MLLWMHEWKLHEMKSHNLKQYPKCRNLYLEFLSTQKPVSYSANTLWTAILKSFWIFLTHKILNTPVSEQVGSALSLHHCGFLYIRQSRQWFPECYFIELDNISLDFTCWVFSFLFWVTDKGNGQSRLETAHTSIPYCAISIIYTIILSLQNLTHRLV